MSIWSRLQKGNGNRKPVEAKTLGEKIRIARINCELSQNDLAKRLKNCSQADISRFEHGVAYPSDEMLNKISRILKVKFAD